MQMQQRGDLREQPQQQADGSPHQGTVDADELQIFTDIESICRDISRASQLFTVSLIWRVRKVANSGATRCAACSRCSLSDSRSASSRSKVSPNHCPASAIRCLIRESSLLISFFTYQVAPYFAKIVVKGLIIF